MSEGALVDGDEIIYIIAASRHRRGHMEGGVVGTLMTNLGLEKALAAMEIPMVRTKVGDRYVIEAMEQNKWTLGGETSGHIICSDLISTGDGLVAALQVVKALRISGQTLSEARRGMNKYPQFLINVPQALPDHLHDPIVVGAVEAVEALLGDSGRVIIRPSGTEPVVRVMVEGIDSAQVKASAERIASSVEKAASIS